MDERWNITLEDKGTAIVLTPIDKDSTGASGRYVESGKPLGEGSSTAKAKMDQFDVAMCQYSGQWTLLK